ncbi:MAG: holo-ACP synthase [Acidobacteriota bacterium]
MIRGLGLDVVAVERVAGMLERHGSRLLDRCFSPGEAARPRDPEHLAGLLAAKEAAFKAIGTGWGEGVGWKDVTVERNASGAPTLRIGGGAAKRMERLGAAHAHLSITHAGGVAAAVVVLES